MTVRDSARTAAFTVLFAVVAAMLWYLRAVLVLVGLAALLAFALDPIVSMFERVRLPRVRISRHVAAAGVMLALVALGAWALVVAIPQLARELARFVEGAPASLERLLAAVRAFAESRGAAAWLGPLGGDEPMSAAELVRRSGGALLTLLGHAFGSIGHIIGLALVPMLAFYLLAEREAVERSALEFVPEEARARVQQVIGSIDRALRSYIRGQSVVCATMGVLVGLAMFALRVPVPFLLGTVVAVAEVVPILGFWTASIVIVLAAWAVGPEHALWAWLAYLFVNQLTSIIVTPRVMGRHLKLHPFVVTVSILAGGTLLGAAGALLALPVAAAIQSLVSEFAPRADSPRGGPAA